MHVVAVPRQHVAWTAFQQQTMMARAAACYVCKGLSAFWCGEWWYRTLGLHANSWCVVAKTIVPEVWCAMPKSSGNVVLHNVLVWCHSQLRCFNACWA
jgi:hypothetical protein